MKKDYYLFWIRSSRGTDSKAVYAFKLGTPKADVITRLEQWAEQISPGQCSPQWQIQRCSTFGAWESSGNFISYGFKKVKIPPRNVLLKQYEKVCKRKNTIEDKWATLAAMLNPR